MRRRKIMMRKVTRKRNMRWLKMMLMFSLSLSLVMRVCILQWIIKDKHLRRMVVK
ncbi:hypothetical protein RchiOBHm_Chr1g0339381 [Rosa chinensis]|uniref:Uncharacterized protein n=1 Tax=Rosa chinensis TaxID=74649 RepID=A0A2P6SD87_ROSCH|nr:hypothetical protein RchiOBHm_Chr1g0339381 [Rosa chinensis]